MSIDPWKRCRGWERRKPHSAPLSRFRQYRDGEWLELAICKDCVRDQDIEHNRKQNDRKRKGLIP